jgi:hypothetical protein
MPVGRPTLYTKKLVDAAWKYANGGWQEAGDPVPSVAGLACEIGVRRETCHAWAKDESKEFSNILGEIAAIQERYLLKGGLEGDFNPSITKMMMTKHGYSDRVEQDLTTSDGSMRPTTVVIKAADERS